MHEETAIFSLKTQLYRWILYRIARKILLDPIYSNISHNPDLCSESIMYRSRIFNLTRTQTPFDIRINRK